MDVGVLAGLVTRIFVFTAIGYGMRKKGLMGDVLQKGLSDMLLGVIMPLNMIAAGSVQYDRRLMMNILWMFVLVIGYYAVTLVFVPLTGKALGLPRHKNMAMSNLITFANVGFIGFPIVQSLYGDEAILYAMVYSMIYNIFAFTVGVWRLGGEAETLKSILLRPATIAPFLSILLFISPIKLPEPLTTSFSAVGVMAAPVSLFVIGGSLAKISFFSMFKDGWSWLVTVVRAFVMPALCAGVALLLGMRGILPAVFVLLSSLPPGATNVIFSEKYDVELDFTTRAISLSTCMMIPLLPLAVFTIDKLFF